MTTFVERVTGVPGKGQGRAFLIALGHSGTHWIIGTLAVLLAYIKDDWGVSFAEIGGLMTIFHVSSFVANGGSGAIVDVSGRRVLMQGLALIVGAGALAASGYTGGLTAMGLCMVVIGLTNNLWHPAAISYLSAHFPNNRGYVLSIHALGANFGDTAAPLAAGFLLVAMNWDGVVKVSALPVVAIAIWIIVALSSHDKAERARGETGMDAGRYFQGVIDMIGNKALLGLCLMAGFRSMTQNGLIVYIPLFLAIHLEAGPVLMGIGVAVFQFCGMLSGPIAGTWSDHVGRRRVVLLGMAMTTLATAVAGLVADIHAFIFVIGIVGFALFAVRPVIHGWLMDLTPENMGGSATSALFATQSALTAPVPIIGGVIADVWGLPVVFHILAGIIFVSTLMVSLVPERRV